MSQTAIVEQKQTHSAYLDKFIWEQKDTIKTFIDRNYDYLTDEYQEYNPEKCVNNDECFSTSHYIDREQTRVKEILLELYERYLDNNAL